MRSVAGLRYGQDRLARFESSGAHARSDRPESKRGSGLVIDNQVHIQQRTFKTEAGVGR